MAKTEGPSLNDLKAAAYDLIAQREALQRQSDQLGQQLNGVNQEIAIKFQEEAIVHSTDPADAKPSGPAKGKPKPTRRTGAPRGRKGQARPRAVAAPTADGAG